MNYTKDQVNAYKNNMGVATSDKRMSDKQWKDLMSIMCTPKNESEVQLITVKEFTEKYPERCTFTTSKKGNVSVTINRGKYNSTFEMARAGQQEIIDL